MTILELVDDEAFNPDYLGPGSHADKKPVPWTTRGRGVDYLTQTKDQLRKQLRCQVPECGVDWAPQGICGYCRGLVKRIRANRVVSKAA